jgi:ppGpp synthetase/RelA/SpoT-type nucleotidyltranferase
VNRTDIDRLGDRLRERLSSEDLEQLDKYRRSFRAAYDEVVRGIRDELVAETSGRPAKSTTAIIEKLKRGSTRLGQMQDVAGCRIVVANLHEQNGIVSKLSAMFESTVSDRREKDSHGYRAVHVVARHGGAAVEIQVRTKLQHRWAELSEKAADSHGNAVKYGGGPPELREMFDSLSELIAVYESAFEAGHLPSAHADSTHARFHDELVSIMNEIARLLEDRP